MQIPMRNHHDKIAAQVIRPDSLQDTLDLDGGRSGMQSTLLATKAISSRM